MNRYEFSVDPRNLKEGDRVVYGHNNRWTVVKKIDFSCEGEGCGIRHLAYVVRFRSEHQAWTVNPDNSNFWSDVCLLKDWPKKKKNWYDRNKKDDTV